MPQNKLTTIQRLRLAAQGLNSQGQDSGTPEPVTAPVSPRELKSESPDNNPHGHPSEHCLVSASASLSKDENALEQLAQELPATLFSLMYGYNSVLKGSEHVLDCSQGEPAPSQVAPARPSIGKEFSTKFEFILSNDPVQARKSVRKHVMQEYWRREQWEKEESIGECRRNASFSFGKGRQLSSLLSAEDGGPCEQESSDPEASPVVGKRRRLDWSPCTTITRTESSKAVRPHFQTQSEQSCPHDNGSLPFRFNPWAAVAAADVDPFSKINFGAAPAMQALLHQYVWNGPRAFDLWAAGTDFHRIAWLYSDIAAYDPEPIPVCFAFALRHMARLRYVEEPPLAFEHRAKALQTINNRLQDPQKAGSNANIGAVINLAGHEYVMGNPKDFYTHMSGLARMIKSRGGMEWFDAHPELRSIIMRLDLMRAYATVSRHRFPQFQVCQALPSLGKQLGIYSESKKDIKNPAGSRFEQAYNFCQGCIALFDGVEDVASLIRTSKSTQEQTEKFCFKQLLEGLVRRLLRREPGVATDESSGLVKGCCRLAVLILVDTMMREAFSSPNYSGHNVRVVKANLLDTGTKLGRALYWLMVAMLHGQRVDIGEPARALYLAEAVLLAMDVSENEWRLIRTRLVKYLEMKQLNDFAGNQISELWEVGPISQSVMDDWI